MKRSELKNYSRAQNIAKNASEYLKTYIKEGVSEADIANAANEFMLSHGATSFWYHDVGSLVLVGDRTTLSISGRDYMPSRDAVVRKRDLVTVDLSPQIDSYWGDFARSFAVSDGRVCPYSCSSPIIYELYEGIVIEESLHQKLQDMITPDMTFSELYASMNRIINGYGCINLDFKNNLGHTIEKDPKDRIYIEEGNKAVLSGAMLFTFEPHIRLEKGGFGYKMEDIYYFSKGKLRRL